MRKSRILLLTFYFPPVNAAGTARARYLSEQLVHAGWQVSVVTPKPSLWLKADDREATEHWLAERGIHRLATDIRDRWRLPGIIRNEGGAWRKRLLWLAARASARMGFDCYSGWPSEIEQSCRHLQHGDVDLIFASGSPFAAFGAARRLAMRLKVPFVLDYRDPWTSNPHGTNRWDWRHTTMEKRLLHEAAAVTCVSERMAAMLRERCHKPDKVHVLSNGYSPEHLNTVVEKKFDHFAIIYAGQLYPPKRSLGPFFEALRKLDRYQSGANWRFHYYGPHGHAVLAAARAAAIEHRLENHGRVSRAEALSATRGAGVVLVITSVLSPASVADAGVVPGKVFEAIGLAVPILAITPAETDLEHILQHAGLAKVFRADDHDGMIGYLEALFNGISIPPRSPEIYSWVNLGVTADALLRRIHQIGQSMNAGNN